jgi:hypothetical protein
MNLSMAYRYVQRECDHGRVASTVIFDCSSSGTVRFAAGSGFVDLSCCFVVSTGSGSFDRSL